MHPRGRGITYPAHTQNNASVTSAAPIPAAPFCTCCPVHGDELSHKLSHAIKLLGKAIEELAALSPKRPYQELIVLSSTTPYTVRDYGRRHVRIWVSAPTTITFSDLLTPYALNAGWNPLDVPAGTVITGPATAVNARYEATDYDVL